MKFKMDDYEDINRSVTGASKFRYFLKGESPKVARYYYGEFLPFDFGEEGLYWRDYSNDENESQDINKIIVDLNQIYPKKYIEILRKDKLQKFKKNVREIDRHLSTSDHLNREGLLSASYILLLWHVYIAMIIKPVFSLKVRGLWEDWMTFENMTLSNKDLSQYTLLNDLADKDISKMFDKDIDRKEMEVITAGMRRIFKAVTRTS